MSEGVETTEVQVQAEQEAETNAVESIVNTPPDDAADFEGSIAVSDGNQGSRKRKAKGSKRLLAKKNR